MAYVQLQLTCSNNAEAEKISETLLEKRLVACVRHIATKSQYVWKGQVEKADEVMLIMESSEDLFNEIETEVAKLHSYDTFVLTATPISKISEKAEKWFNRSLKDIEI